MTHMIDLIADVGESFGNYEISGDNELLPILTSANVACGFHAGDPRVMHETVRRCVESGVAIGGHPGFPDLVGFGRRDMDMSRHEVFTDVLYQIGALDAFVRAHGASLQHVTPHGRLGHRVQSHSTYAKGAVDAIEKFNPALVVVGIGGHNEMLIEAQARGMRTAQLGFPDRAYENDGRLVRRDVPGAILKDPKEMAARAVRMVAEGLITSIHGVDIPVKFDLILLHGDHPTAIQNAINVRRELEAAGIVLAPLAQVLEHRSPGVIPKGR